MDATVTDSSGRVVRGLTAADFEILYGGKPLAVAEFAYVGLRADSAGTFHVQPWPSALPSGQRDDHLSLVVVVDDLSLSADGRTQVQDALGKFIDSQVRPGDAVSIVKSSGGTGASQQLTSDPALLHASLNSLARAGATGPDSVARAAALSGGTLGLLRSVLEGVAGLQGRKIVVLFSENMHLFQSPQVPVELLSTRANRTSAVVYAVDPRGLGAAARSAQSLDQLPASAGVGALARNTGGIFFDNTNDTATVMTRVLADQEGYYRIECTTDNDDSMIKGVTLRVKRNGLRVRVRNEFPNDVLVRYSGGTPLPLSTLLPVSPFGTGGISLRLTPLVSYTAASSIEALLHIDVRGLTFTRDAQGVNRAELEFVAAGFSGDGQETGRIGQSYSMSMADGALAQALLRGVTTVATLPVRTPGPIQVHALVRDITSGSMGSARESFEFPDLQSGRFLMSGIFVGGDPDVKPAEPGENSADRIFRAGRTVVYLYTLFNLRADPQKQVRLESQLRVFRGEETIYSGELKKETLAVTGPPRDPTRLTRKGTLNLLPNARPGTYSLQLTVTDRTDENNLRSATQTMDFEVR